MPREGGCPFCCCFSQWFAHEKDLHILGGIPFTSRPPHRGRQTTVITNRHRGSRSSPPSSQLAPVDVPQEPRSLLDRHQPILLACNIKPTRMASATFVTIGLPLRGVSIQSRRIVTQASTFWYFGISLWHFCLRLKWQTFRKTIRPGTCIGSG